MFSISAFVAEFIHSKINFDKLLEYVQKHNSATKATIRGLYSTVLYAGKPHGYAGCFCLSMLYRIAIPLCRKAPSLWRNGHAN